MREGKVEEVRRGVVKETIGGKVGIVKEGVAAKAIEVDLEDARKRRIGDQGEGNEGK